MKKLDCLEQLLALDFNMEACSSLVRIAIVLELPMTIVSFLLARGCRVRDDTIETAIRFHNHAALSLLADYAVIDWQDHMETAVETTSGRCLSVVVEHGGRATEDMRKRARAKDKITFGRVNCDLLVDSCESYNIKRRRDLLCLLEE